MKVMGRWSVVTVDVRADGTGLCSWAGSALLALVADRVGLTGGLCETLQVTRERRSAHVPGRVLCDLAVMLADGGRCVSDLAALAGQESLFGNVASVSTARRVVQSVGESELAGIRAARTAARARACGRSAGAGGHRFRRDASRRSRPPAPTTCRSTSSRPTPHGSNSRCARTTSRSGRSCSGADGLTPVRRRRHRSAVDRRGRRRLPSLRRPSSWSISV